MSRNKMDEKEKRWGKSKKEKKENKQKYKTNQNN